MNFESGILSGFVDYVFSSHVKRCIEYSRPYTDGDFQLVKIYETLSGKSLSGILKHLDNLLVSSNGNF